MKYQYKEIPESMSGTYGEFAKNFGFDWKEFIMGIPTPMFLVTTYKSNGQPNATMQSWVEAPMVAECFMNLECRYLWEKEIVPGDDHVMICLEVVGGHIEKDYMEDMFGDKGVLYNVHYPINPEDVKEKGCDYVAALKKVNQSYEY